MNTPLEEALDRVLALEAENAELRRDRERLAWIYEQETMEFRTDPLGEKILYTKFRGPFLGASVEAVIDAAMEGK